MPNRFDKSKKECVVIFDDSKDSRTTARWMVVSSGIVISRHIEQEMAIKIAENLNRRMARQ